MHGLVGDRAKVDDDSAPAAATHLVADGARGRARVGARRHARLSRVQVTPPYGAWVDVEPGRDLSGRPVQGSSAETSDGHSRSALTRYRVFLNMFLPSGTVFVILGLIRLLTGDSDGGLTWLVGGFAWIALGLLVQVVIDVRGRRRRGGVDSRDGQGA